VITPAPVVVDAEAPVTPGADSALDPVAKKARNLNKKVPCRS
jgi:translation initiation factor 2A